MDLSVNDEIIVQIEDNKLILTKKEENQTNLFDGSHEDIWNNTDGEEYLKDEGNGADNSS